MARSPLKSINPYTQELIKEYKPIPDYELHKYLEAAETAFHDWKNVDIEERASLMALVGEELLDQKMKYAQKMTLEMGKPITQAIAEVEKCAWLCEFYAENGPAFLTDKSIETDADNSYVSYAPIGPVLAVMPWNYPYWQVFRFAIPSLIAGNVGLLKHASSVSACALAIEKIFIKVGVPENVFQTLLIHSEQVEQILRDPTVRAATLTGSKAAGSAVASVAGEEIKKTVLELGGSNACIVCDDADLDNHIETIAWMRFQNAGQSCIAGKRFIVMDDIYDNFMDRLLEIVRGYKIGDPTDKKTVMGPMSSKELAAELNMQLQNSLHAGAHLVHGGQCDDARFQPTIIANVQTNMPAFQEETFGPVAACMRVKTMKEAVQLLNTSDFGLGASIFTDDVESAINWIPEINEGAVFVNELVKSDPRLPFGGTKSSGYGRELSSDGIKEFVNRKTVYINN